jgi:hypothetical protein
MTYPREPNKLLLILSTQLRMYRSQSRLFPRKLLIEITSIGCGSNNREVRRWDTFMVNIIKVDIFEE